MSEQQVMEIMLDDIVPILLPIIGDSQALSTNPLHIICKDISNACRIEAHGDGMDAI